MLNLETKIRHLDKNVRLAWLFPTAAALSVLWLIAVLLYFIAPPDSGAFGIDKVTFPLMLLALLLIILAAVYGFIHLSYESFTYELNEKEIVIREGIITRKTTVIPYGRIQDIRSERSLVERLLGLASIDIETAAGSSQRTSTMQIPGIANKDAFISELMMRAEKSRTADGVGEEGAKPTTEQMVGEVLKELKVLSYKIETLSSKVDGGKGGKKEPSEVFSPLDFDMDFKRGKKKLP